MSTKALPEILDPTTSRESLSSAKLGTSADDGRHPTYENLGFGIVASGLPKDRQELLVDLSFGIWDKAKDFLGQDLPNVGDGSPFKLQQATDMLKL